MRILILLLFPLFSYSQLSIGILESSRKFVGDSTAPKAFIIAANITNATQISAIYSLAFGLQQDGLWTKMKAIYPMVGGSASSHKYNLKDPRDLDAAFRLLFVGGWTHSSTGATPNGTSGYAITYLNPSTSLTISSAHFSKYNRTNDLAGNKIDGIFDGLTSFFQQNYSAGNGIIGDIGTIGSYTQTDTRGLFTSTRTAANVYKVFKNSTQVATNTSTNTTIPNYNFWIGARNNANSALFYNTYECAFASIGDGLTDTDAANFYTRVQAYQTSLSRQINP